MVRQRVPRQQHTQTTAQLGQQFPNRNNVYFHPLFTVFFFRNISISVRLAKKISIS